jgi:hypothetical protein
VPSHEVVIDMIEALGPGVDSSLLQVDKLDAETTPETRLTIAADSTSVKLFFDGA